MKLLAIVLRRRILWTLTLLPMVAAAAETVQPGFVLHDEGKANLSLSGVRSGEICAGMGVSDTVCNTGTQLTVQGQDACVGNDGKTYPCTRYGYRYDYAGASPGTEIECTSTRRDPYRSQDKSYTIAVDAESGSVYQPQWIPYSPVERRMMLTEVHRCSYLGEPLASIEYIISYEPSMAPPTTSSNDRSADIDEPFLPGVPNACNYLTEDLSGMWIRHDVRRYDGAIEHLPILRSHCAWLGEDDLGKIAKMEHKFHLYELFDVENLRRDQLLFHATFAAGGHAPESVRTDLGKLTFVYHLPEEDRSAISVVTGIQGPTTNAGQPMELLAHYHVRTPDRTHQERLACLFDLARKSLDLWFNHISPSDNTVNPPHDPTLGATCPSVLGQE